MWKTASTWAVLVPLSGALLAATWLGADTGDAASIERGRAHIEKTCLRCHAGPLLDALVRQKVADREFSAALDGFLASHHVADPALRADVLAALQRRSVAGADEGP